MGVKEDLVKLKGNVLKWTATDEGYRGFVAGILLVVGWFALLGPLEKRLVQAREDRESLSKLATWVEEIRELEGQTGSFEERMVAEKNPTDWDNYIKAAIGESGAKMLASTERKSESIMDYTFYIRELMVTGSFEQLVELMDLLERGDRYLRIDEFAIRPQNNTLSLRATVRCFVGETTAQKRARMYGGGA
ncbi:MAG: hypothetical protein CMJ94_03015 [Planctomycetes bacterium]|nr:hypothetical protein [Planctomycetota bacterium]